MSLPKTSDQRKTNLDALADPRANPRGAGDTITQCAIITGTGRSAIAVIVLRGDDAENIVSASFEAATKSRFLPGEIRYGVWRGFNERDAGESVVVTPMDESDHFEIHCHGGSAATARIIDDLRQAGAVESPMDCLLSIHELVHEAVGVLSRCVTPRTAAIALDQVRGALLGWATISRQRLESEQCTMEEIAQETREILRHANFGTRLTEPFCVVLTGPPNVGKSSLLNAIVGYDRSITMDQAGTTRDILHADTVIDGLPIRLSDTAGIRDSNEPIEQQGVKKALQATQLADLILCVSQPGVTEIVPSPRPSDGPPRMNVLNKIDLIPSGEPLPKNHFLTNALTGQGIPELMAAISKSLISEQPKPGSPVPITDRQVALLRQLEDHARAGNQERLMSKLREICARKIP